MPLWFFSCGPWPTHNAFDCDDFQDKQRGRARLKCAPWSRLPTGLSETRFVCNVRAHQRLLRVLSKTHGRWNSCQIYAERQAIFCCEPNSVGLLISRSLFGERENPIMSLLSVYFRQRDAFTKTVASTNSLSIFRGLSMWKCLSRTYRAGAVQVIVLDSSCDFSLFFFFCRI